MHDTESDHRWGWLDLVCSPASYTQPPNVTNPSFPVHDTESDPRWGQLDLACETRKIMGTM